MPKGTGKAYLGASNWKLEFIYWNKNSDKEGPAVEGVEFFHIYVTYSTQGLPFFWNAGEFQKNRIFVRIVIEIKDETNEYNNHYLLDSAVDGLCD